MIDPKLRVIYYLAIGRGVSTSDWEAFEAYRRVFRKLEIERFPLNYYYRVNWQSVAKELIKEMANDPAN